MIREMLGIAEEAFSRIRVPVVFPIAAPNLEPRDDIWPTETAPVFRRREATSPAWYYSLRPCFSTTPCPPLLFLGT